MVDITEISAVVAAAGVLIGVVYYILEMRHQTKIRKSDTFWKIYQSFNSKEFIDAAHKVMNLEFRDYNDFLKKYGPPFAESPVATAIALVCNMYEGAGELLHRGLADYENISNISTGMAWEKVKLIVEGARKQYNFPSYYDKFEYLYNEMKKREQRGVKNG
jgi:hypothetical protein